MSGNAFDKFTKGPGAKYVAIAFGVLILIFVTYNGATVGPTAACGSLTAVGFIITGFSVLLFLYKHDKDSFNNITSSLSTSSPVSPVST